MEQPLYRAALLDDSSVVRLDHHERLICVGDLHGDLLAFLAPMTQAGLIKVDAHVWKQATTCHTLDGRSGVADAHLTSAEINTIKWVGETACIALLGDLVDNQRGGEPIGRCALPSTQQTLMHVVEHVQKEARSRGGRLVVTLGNQV